MTRTPGILWSALLTGVKTPWRMRRSPAYSLWMKHNNFSQGQNQKPANTPQPVAAPLSQNEINFTPAPDEVARRAYFSYENQGSLPGREVQHWLKAEAELIAERNLTRVHGFHNRT
jgi:hypothetical protein